MLVSLRETCHASRSPLEHDVTAALIMQHLDTFTLPRRRPASACVMLHLAQFFSSVLAYCVCGVAEHLWFQSNGDHV